jgi:excisionase family DNA binding protein
VANSDDQGGLLTAEQVAKLLNVSDEWVYVASRKRLIGSVRVGGLVRFRREVIEEYIAEHTQEAA